MDELRLAVVGSTGAVGREILRLLNRIELLNAQVVPAASAASAGVDLGAELGLELPIEPVRAIEDVDFGDCPPYPTPRLVERSGLGRAWVHVGRVRVDPVDPTALWLWIVADNVRVGAALNAVNILQTVLKYGWLERSEAVEGTSEALANTCSVSYIDRHGLWWTRSGRAARLPQAHELRVPVWPTKSRFRRDARQPVSPAGRAPRRAG